MQQVDTIYLERLNKAIYFIENNLDKKILLKEISQHALLSEYHFHRIFKSFTGETVKEFLVRLKIERAANRLKNTKDDIGQIAFENGFENHESFTRAFKRYFERTPKEFRTASKEQIEIKRTAYVNSAINLENLQVQEPIIKQLPDLHLAYIRHTGSYDKVASSFQRLMLWAAAHFVLKLSPRTLGIVHDNPELTAEDKIRFDACVLVNQPIKANGEVGYKKIEGGKFAVFRYKGAYENFYTVYDYIYNSIVFDRGFELADKPALEWYIKSPPFYKPDQYVTDFYLPLK